MKFHSKRIILLPRQSLSKLKIEMGFAGQTPSLRWTQIKPILVELRHKGASEVDIEVSMGVNTHFLRGGGEKGLNCSMFKQVSLKKNI